VDISYFESGYIDATYFSTVYDGQAELRGLAATVVSITGQFGQTARLQADILIVATGIRIKSYVGYTIYEPIAAKVPFSQEYFSEVPA
jgi:hypothetical protein